VQSACETVRSGRLSIEFHRDGKIEKVDPDDPELRLKPAAAKAAAKAASLAVPASKLPRKRARVTQPEQTLSTESEAIARASIEPIPVATSQPTSRRASRSGRGAEPVRLLVVGDRVQAFNKSGTLYHASIYRVIDGGKKYKVDWDDCDPAGRTVNASDVIEAGFGFKVSSADQLRMEERQRRRDEGDSSSSSESDSEPELKEEKRQPSPAKKKPSKRTEPTKAVESIDDKSADEIEELLSNHMAYPIAALRVACEDRSLVLAPRETRKTLVAQLVNFVTNPAGLGAQTERRRRDEGDSSFASDDRDLKSAAKRVRGVQSAAQREETTRQTERRKQQQAEQQVKQEHKRQQEQQAAAAEAAAVAKATAKAKDKANAKDNAVSEHFPASYT
jgi:hypothetical protein